MGKENITFMSNNIVTNYEQILEYAQNLQLPIYKKRAIIREYLQSLAISTLFSLSQSKKLSFVGGTALRLLRNIDRFSEDLDFDNLGLKSEEIDILIQMVVDRFERENIQVETIIKHQGDKNYYEFRFPNLLFDLHISTNPREKLMIKIDYASIWKGQTTETMLFSKYGFIEHVITNPIDQLIVQKLAAYVQRKQTQSRDIYDIVWLFAKGARIDQEFCKANKLDHVLQDAIDKAKLEGVSNRLKSHLEPFLFNQDNIGKMDLLPQVLNSLL